MLLPIIENKAESDTIPQDFDLKSQEIADMNTHSVLITGEIKGHRDALFYHIIRKYFCIPISVINKENEFPEENTNPYPDILTSMMKGLYEDIHGKIIDDPSTPFPYAVIKEEVKSNEQSKTFCIICPTHEKYEEKLAHNRPNSDILLHCLDYQSIKDQSDVQAYLCDNLKEPIQGLRSNQIVLLLHMDDIEEIKAGELQKLETNC